MGCSSSAQVEQGAPIKAYVMEEALKQHCQTQAGSKAFSSEASTCTPGRSLFEVPMYQKVASVDIDYACEDRDSQCSFASLACVWDVQDLAEQHPLAPDYNTHMKHVASLEGFLRDVERCPDGFENKFLPRNEGIISSAPLQDEAANASSVAVDEFTL
mmetsp:Transcript_75564/g.179542  ORF Transcript_75564/g.179542 Transcript_75564/m.179542 type:complete len:158 (-) Transcript_75564:65-538(-)